MDLASLIAILLGVGLILTAILFDGSIHNFINIPGVMIVFGGTLASTLLTFPFKTVIAAFRAAIYVFSHIQRDPNDMVATMIELCNISRRKGLLELSHIETDSVLLKKACNLIADGTEAATLHKTLRIEIDALKSRHFIVQDVFKKMGTYAPAFGLLGTLIGLIQMLSNMSDPSTIGPGMSIALITTFYGFILATLFFNPVAGKLKARTIVEITNLEIIFEGAISLLENNHPLFVYEKLSSHIPAKQRRPMKRNIKASHGSR